MTFWFFGFGGSPPRTEKEWTQQVSVEITILKEDRKVFEALASKAISPREACPYLCTAVSLALASPDSDLKQGCTNAL